MSDKTIKVYIPLTPLLMQELKGLAEADGVEVEMPEQAVDFMVRYIEKQRAPSYEKARASLLCSIMQDVARAEVAARALEHLERAEETRVDRDTPAAFIEHAKRLLESDDRHNVVQLAKQAVDEWEDEHDEDEDEDD